MCFIYFLFWHHNLSLEPIYIYIYWHLLYEIGSKYRNFALISFEVRIEAKDLCNVQKVDTVKRHLTMGRCQKVDTNIIKRITKRRRSNAVKIYSIDCQTSLTTPILKTLLSLIILTNSWLKKPWCHIIIIRLWSTFVICRNHLVRTWYYGWQLWIILLLILYIIFAYDTDFVKTYISKGHLAFFNGVLSPFLTAQNKNIQQKTTLYICFGSKCN